MYFQESFAWKDATLDRKLKDLHAKKYSDAPEPKHRWVLEYSDRTINNKLIIKHPFFSFSWGGGVKEKNTLSRGVKSGVNFDRRVHTTFCTQLNVIHFYEANL